MSLTAEKAHSDFKDKSNSTVETLLHSFNLFVVIFKSSVILWYKNCADCFFKPKTPSIPSLGRYNLRKHRSYFGLHFHASCLCPCHLPVAECSLCYLQAAAGQAKSLGMAQAMWISRIRELLLQRAPWQEVAAQWIEILTY